MEVPPQDTALETRESAYRRHSIGHQISKRPGQRADTDVFAIPKSIQCQPGENSTLLLSYIDVVVQGYFRMFGEPGVQDFFDTTAGWGAQIINDRAAPIYPRHQLLSDKETTMVDDGLARLDTKITLT